MRKRCNKKDGVVLAVRDLGDKLRHHTEKSGNTCYKTSCNTRMTKKVINTHVVGDLILRRGGGAHSLWFAR